VDELRCRQEALLATVDATLDPEAQQQLAAAQQKLSKVPAYREKCAALMRAMATAERRRAALAERTSRLRAATAVTVAAVLGASGHAGAAPADPGVNAADAAATPPAAPLFSETGGRYGYRVVYPGGVSVRAAPTLEARKTGVVLKAGVLLEASERLGPAFSSGSAAGAVASSSNDVFVRLADGSGWAFEAKGSTPILERVSLLTLDQSTAARDAAPAGAATTVVEVRPPIAAGTAGSSGSSGVAAKATAVAAEPPPLPESVLVGDFDFEEGDV
jgi:hypothetical protein